MSIEELRYEDRLNVEYQSEDEIFLIPALTLQPLVENLIKHGVAKGYIPQHMKVSTYRENGNHVVVVEDDGPGFDPDNIDEAHHVGLRSVRERLDLIAQGIMQIESRCDGYPGTKVTLRVPFEKK